MPILPDPPLWTVGPALAALAAAGLAVHQRARLSNARTRLRTRRPRPTAPPVGGRDVPFEALSLVVLGVCFVLSWDVLVELARASGLDHDLAVIYPVSIDALAAAAYRAAVRLRDAPWHVRRVPMVVTVAFVALSVMGNALHAWAPTGGSLTVPRGVAASASAVPPLSGAVIVHLYALVRRWAGTSGQPMAVTESDGHGPPETRPAAPDLIAAGLTVAAGLAAAGQVLNRDTLAAGVRAEGHPLPNDVAQALLVLVRREQALRAIPDQTQGQR